MNRVNAFNYLGLTVAEARTRTSFVEHNTDGYNGRGRQGYGVTEEKTSRVKGKVYNIVIRISIV